MSRSTWPATPGSSGRLRLRGVTYRLVAAVVVLATIPLGHLMAIAQLAAILLIMVGLALVEDLPRVRQAGGSTAISTFGRTRTE